MIKQSILISLFIIILNSSNAIAQTYADNVKNVGFNSGAFTTSSDGFWVERRADNSIAFQFSEVQRTDYTVNLSDKSRGVLIMLNMIDKKIYFSDQNNSNLRELYQMTWMDDGKTFTRIRNANNQPIDNNGNILATPNLGSVWNSDFGPIHWSEGFYDNPEKTLRGGLGLENGRYVFRGVWGRKSDPSVSKSLIFTFAQGGKSFEGLYEAQDGSQKAWNGFAQ